MTLNRGWTFREQVGGGAPGSLVAYLASHHPHSSPEVWSARLAAGEIELDGAVVRTDAPLCPGQVITWHRPPWDEPEVPLEFDTIHEDRWVVAVSKPAGLPTVPAGGYLEHTLLARVRHRWPGASPLHRLGRHTSGLVLFARDHEAAASLSRAWRDHEVRKHYLALGAGVPQWEDREITASIGPVAHPVLGLVHAASVRGKPSRSVAHVVERRADASVFRVEITTGRPHQVRIHLAYAGHPLVGDPLYAVGGVPLAERPGLPGDGGYLLHAERLAFAHPGTGMELELAAPVPAGLQRSARSRTATSAE